MNQLHSVCHKHFEPFAFIVDITKDNLTVCPEEFPDTCHIIWLKFPLYQLWHLYWQCSWCLFPPWYGHILCWCHCRLPISKLQRIWLPSLTNYKYLACLYLVSDASEKWWTLASLIFENPLCLKHRVTFIFSRFLTFSFHIYHSSFNLPGNCSSQALFSLHTFWGLRHCKLNSKLTATHGE